MSESQQQKQRHEVFLAVYDLSHGMARNLSQQFLGITIDMIPHTGLVVFGKEYFFGNGIESMNPNAFRQSMNIFPIQTQSLGQTQVTQFEFETWCSTIASSRFNRQAYDLLTHNCNHFSNVAATEGLRLQQGVPQWIMDIPQRFLSSPMGQMIRPMLEQMQITNTPAATSTVGGGRGGNNVAIAGSRVDMASSTSAIANGATNPWASMSNDQTSAINTTKNIALTVSTVTNANSKTTSISTASTSYSILNKYKSSMLSKDTNTLALCNKKLTPVMELIGLEESWKQLHEQLKKDCDTSTIRLGHVEENGGVSVPAVDEIWRLLISGNYSNLEFYLLLVVRLIVLKTGYTGMTYDKLKFMVNRMQSKEWETPALHAMGWCVLSNYVGAQISDSTVQDVQCFQELVDIALRDISSDQQPSVQVRQAASTYLYNYIQWKQQSERDKVEELGETFVSILCSSVDGTILEEKDPTTQLRRLLQIGRILFPLHKSAPSLSSSSSSKYAINDTAKTLAVDLGIVDTLQELSNRSQSNNPYAKECRLLADELLTLLQ